jgi:proline iminopeptidase
MGHSWSAVFVAMALAKYPDSFHQAILLEPNGFSSEIQSQVGLALDLLTAGYLDMAWAVDGLSPRDHDLLDYDLYALLDSGVRDLNCDEDDLPEWPVWRPGGLALVHWEASILEKGRLDFDVTRGMSDYPGRVLFVGTDCSPIGAEFQQNGNLQQFPGAELLTIEDSGHRLVTEQLDALVAGLRAWLAEGR